MKEEKMLTETPVTPTSDGHIDREDRPLDGEIVLASAPLDESPPEKQRLRWKWKWKWLLFALLPLVMMGGSLGLGSKLMKSLPGNGAATKPLTQAVERKTMPISITANGNIRAARSINLSPKTAGIVKTLLVKEGDRVSRGQVIAMMDDSSLRGQLLQYQGQLVQQQANLQRLQAGNRPEDIAKAEAQLAEVTASLQALQAGNRPQDIAKAEAQLAEAKASLQQLQAGNRPQEIAQANAKLQQSQATLRQREGDWQRYQQLHKSGAISGQTLEQKRADRDVAQNQVIEAQQVLALQKAGTRVEQIAQAQAKVEQQAQSVALLKAGARKEEITQAQAKVQQQVQTVAALKAGNRQEDIAQARAQVQAAQGALTTIQEQLKDTQVVAPFDGIVLEKFADIGAFVSPSMAGGGGSSATSSSILTLTSIKQQVVVNLSESQIAKVKLGQAVTITADAFPGEQFTGKVEQISPQAKISQNVTSVEVRVSIAERAPSAIDSAGANKLKAGMNVESQFAVGRSENTIFVPNAAVVKQAEGTGVYVWGSDNKPVFRQIQTGMTVGKQTEVKSGLAGNEEVLLSPPADQKPSGGMKFPPAPP
jgi:HlyD family secretion protein